MGTQPAALSLLALAGIPLVKTGDNLVDIVMHGLAQSQAELARGDVIVLAQKIVSKAEGRQVALNGVTPSPRALELAAKVGKDPRLVELVLSESKEVVRTCPGVLVVAHRLGHVMANAGIDQSNVNQGDDEQALLLPFDPDGTCRRIRDALRERTGVDVAVMIIDSFGRAWRNGTVGTAIGVSGMPGLLNLRGEPDLFGRELQTTELGLADELAAAASLIMGQASEGRPVVLARGVPYARREGTASELLRPKELDMFR
ncbi:MAG: coenzyme F420-0:L-glutamate ligase [Gallionella sp.]|nr:coenzyme F420-0:L-glutamate ligase [Gallionella sp.]